MLFLNSIFTARARVLWRVTLGREGDNWDFYVLLSERVCFVGDGNGNTKSKRRDVVMRGEGVLYVVDGDGGGCENVRIVTIRVKARNHSTRTYLPTYVRVLLPVLHFRLSLSYLLGVPSTPLPRPSSPQYTIARLTPQYLSLIPLEHPDALGMTLEDAILRATSPSLSRSQRPSNSEITVLY